jgi:hypothetical protein
VALQGGRLDVDASGQDHVAVEAADHRGLVLGGHAIAEGDRGMVDALPLGGEELDQLGPAALVLGPEDLGQVRAEVARDDIFVHVHSWISSALGVSGAGWVELRRPGARGVRPGGPPV